MSDYHRQHNDTSAEIDALIVRYLSGEATEEEVGILNDWVNRSDDNQQYFAGQKNIWANLHPAFDHAGIDVEAAHDRVLAMIDGSRRQHSWVSRLARVWARIAAVIVIPLALVVFYLYESRQADESVPVEISAAYGGTLETTLPDGSRVWLNSNSTLSYSLPFGGGRRQVSLTGEGYFEIKADRQSPFVVSTRQVDVIAVGTAFNVNAYGGGASDGSTSVTLVSGHVSVEVAGGGGVYPMEAGQNLVIKSERVVVTGGADTDKICSWRRGILDFNDDTLEQIFNRLEQIYQVRFIVDSQATRDYRFHAQLDGESLGEILHLLELSTPIRIIRLPSQPSGDALPQYRVTHL